MGAKFTIVFIWIFSCNYYLKTVNLEPLTQNMQTLKRTYCRCGTVNDPLEARIVGGRQTIPHKYPWLAQIYVNDKFHCGGAVINDNYIMTAAHCALNDKLNRVPTSSISIILGVHDKHNVNEPTRQNYRVIKIKIPTAFYSDYLHDVHDIALFKVDRQILYTKSVSPLCLPRDNIFKYNGMKGIVVGWGVQSTNGVPSQYPFEATVEVIKDETCKNVTILGGHFAEDTLAMFCAYNRFSDACQGDSGGPIFLEEDQGMVAIGIISWGLKCAQKGIPGVYTRLTYYLDWIKKNTLDANYCN